MGQATEGEGWCEGGRGILTDPFASPAARERTARRGPVDCTVAEFFCCPRHAVVAAARRPPSLGSRYTGPAHLQQYEALCRHALAREYGIPSAASRPATSNPLPNPAQHSPPDRSLWTATTRLRLPLLRQRQVPQAQVLLTDLMTSSASTRHPRPKAMLITNTGFSPPPRPGQRQRHALSSSARHFNPPAPRSRPLQR